MTTSAEGECWLWDRADGVNLPFSHPADSPLDDEVLAKARFVDRIIGPRAAKICKVKILDSKGDITMIAKPDGSNMQVQRSRLLPWYEGLLLLQQMEVLEASKTPSWFDPDLRALLEKERKNFKTGIKSGLYTEKKLLTVAVTGARVLDSDDKEWSYRRDGLRSDDKVPQSSGDGEDPGFFKIRDVTGYMPPWEAFCNEACGLYQDFYQVRWDHPFSEVDYSRVENGVKGVLGSTWEPDECLPPQLDVLRSREKRNWMKKKKEEERLMDGSEHASKRQRVDEAPAPPVQRRPIKTAKFRRDGQPLHQDVFHSKVGHDFVPEELENRAIDIRQGWPKKPSEYPEGYGVASPPGFCLDTCDCMDDQRPQKAWETSKNWLEDVQRNLAAHDCIEQLAAQTRFVRRRGQVSKMSFFETATTILGDQTHVRASLDLADEVAKAIKDSVKEIPLFAISSDSPDSVFLPAKAFLPQDQDYEPLVFVLQEPALSPWASVGTDTGQLTARQPPSVRPAVLKLELRHLEGVAGVVECRVTDRPKGGQMPWHSYTARVVSKFNDQRACQLVRNARIVLQEHLADLFDFERNIPKDVSLGSWLDTMSRILRMLRSTASANLVRTEASMMRR